ncbi:hypothetical protein R1sor_000644 [Riccia sorocarpa]|uniref:BTB domain-containing protein n=1 Tax=Riccia sorocarpa TaxID=122646 RepID=A0ABD3GTN9_9MARC
MKVEKGRRGSGPNEVNATSIRRSNQDLKKRWWHPNPKLNWREKGLEKKLRCLRAYEVSPLSEDFGGDVKFIGCDGKSVYAHRFVLAGRSTVFQRMFDTEMNEKKSGIIRVEDTPAPVLRSLVNYCYTAEIEFTEEAPPNELLKVADKYEIEDLKAVCEDELSKHISKDNLSKRVTLARLYNAKKLDRMTQEFFKENFDAVYQIFVGEIMNIIPSK